MKGKTVFTISFSIGQLRVIEQEIRRFHFRVKEVGYGLDCREKFYCAHYRNRDYRRIMRLAKRIDRLCDNAQEDFVRQDWTPQDMEYMRDVSSIAYEALEDKAKYYKDNDLDYGDRTTLKSEMKRLANILSKMPMYSDIREARGENDYIKGQER